MKKIWILAAIGALIILAIIFISVNVKREPASIEIGILLPLTGDAAQYGESMKKGIELAIDEVNQSHGIKGKKIILAYEDDRADPALGVSAFRKLVTINKVPAVIGGATSSVTLAVAPVAEKNKIVFLSPASSAPAITNAGDYIFRNCTSDVFDGMVMANYAVQELKLKMFGILYINNDFGLGLGNSFKVQVEKLGGKVVHEEAFEQGVTDFRTQVSKLIASRPEAVFFVAYKEAGRILRQAKELRFKTKFLSVGIFEDPLVFELAGNAAHGVYYTYRSYDPNSEDIRTKTFVNNFRSKFATDPDLYTVYSYDAAKILAFAMGKSDLSGSGIKDSLYAVKKFPGVTGDITFDSNGDVLLPMGIKVVDDKSFKWVIRDYFKP
jgi:branched-chain amino acid transport system substrate-binding protein